MATFYGGEQLVRVIEGEFSSTAGSTTIYTVPAGMYANLQILYSTANSESRFRIDYNTASFTSKGITPYEPSDSAGMEDRGTIILIEGSKITTQGSNSERIVIRIEEYKKP